MRASIPAALLLAALAAPAGAQTAARPPLLRLGEYLDTAAVRTKLAALPPLREEKRMARVFRLAFDSVGRPLPPVPAVPRAMPRHFRDAVGPLILAALRPVEPRRLDWGTLILVETGDPARVEEIHPVRRAPRVVNTGEFAAAVEDSANALADADSALVGKTVAPMVAMEVDEEGVMSSPIIHRSSGVAAVDRMALRVVTLLRFAPLLLDGEPAPTRVVLPIRIIIEGGLEPAKPPRP